MPDQITKPFALNTFHSTVPRGIYEYMLYCITIQCISSGINDIIAVSPCETLLTSTDHDVTLSICQYIVYVWNKCTCQTAFQLEGIGITTKLDSNQQERRYISSALQLLACTFNVWGMM